MGKNPLKVMRAFIESGLSLLCIYATVPMFFLGMNIKFDWLQVMGRMVLLNLVLYFHQLLAVQVSQRRASLYYFLSCCLVVLLVLWQFYGVLQLNTCRFY